MMPVFEAFQADYAKASTHLQTLGSVLWNYETKFGENNLVITLVWMHNYQIIFLLHHTKLKDFR
ncbi:hypothetical protein SD80_003225 [Scytonema tolypothrichoides VB-61278]|nr:hypothetical protein SD80_003225 [Scytonema tolypothrichoides VB-61278]